MKPRVRFFVACSAILVLAACSGSKPSPTPQLSSPTPIPEQVIAPEITGLEVLVLSGESDSVRAVIQGQLPDGCFQLGDAEVTPGSSGWIVNLKATRLAGALCTGGVVGFERVVSVETRGRPGGTYQVSAGNQTDSFQLEGARTQAAAVEPTSPRETAVPQADPTDTIDQTSGPASASNPVIPDTSTCELKAAFYDDLTVPDGTIFMEGESFTKSWKIRNEGTCAWDDAYALVFAGGDILNAPLSVPLKKTAPEEFLEISVQMAAPPGGGIHTSLWEFLSPDGRRFGVNSGGIDKIWAKIAVRQALAADNLVAVAAAPTQEVFCGGQADANVATILLDLINAARSANGQSQLSLDRQLTAAANAHSQDMACNDFIDHTGTDGSTWRERIKAQGYAFAAAAENIYVGNPAFGGDARGAFDWWMNSQVHRDNILSRKVTEIGIGYVFRQNSQYGGYYTLVFARP